MIALYLLPETQLCDLHGAAAEGVGLRRQATVRPIVDRPVPGPDGGGRCESWACPRRPVKDDPALFGELMSLYGMCAEGVLADEGGVMSQAVKYLAIMRLIHGTVNECRAEQMEKKS